jgi:hypothetical protein
VPIIHATQLPLLFLSAVDFGRRFRPSGFRLHLSCIHLKYCTPLCVLPELHNHDCTQLHNIRITSTQLMFKFKLYLLRMQPEAEVPSAETMVEYRMVRGPKPRAEMIE